VGNAAAEVGAQRRAGVADRAIGVGRAGGVVLGDRTALVFVAGEQLFASPFAQDPGQLPAEVVAVANRRVEAGGAAGGDPVGGVADEEGIAVAEAVGQCDPEGDGFDPFEARLEAGVARGATDRVGHPLRGQGSGVGRVVLGGKDPAVGAVGRHEGRARVLAGEEVDRVAMLADQVPERGAKQGHPALADLARTGGADPQRRADRAAGAVGGDQVGGVDRALATGVVNERHLEAIASALQLGHRGAPLEAAAAEAPEVLFQHRLEMVLGHAGRPGRAEQEALLAARESGVDRFSRRGRSQRLGHPGAQLDPDLSGADAPLDSP